MGNWVSTKKTIASIFPMAVRAERPYGKGPVTDAATGEKGFDGRSLFEIPAVPKGEVKTLTIEDCWQAQYDKTSPGTPQTTSPVTCDEIANDLIRNWAGSMILTTAGSGPGIAIIAGDQPTPAELSAMKARQSAFFETLFYAAEKFFNDGKMEHIQPLHRKAAEWLGKEPEWLHSLTGDANVKCPICTKTISSAAYKCPHCQSAVKALPPHLLALQEQYAPQAQPTPGQPARKQ